MGRGPRPSTAGGGRRTVISQAEPNDVVLVHDIHPTSVAAVPEVLRTLTACGYHFATVSHLRATM
ncbi:hypothetical protein [Streptomyces cyaneus]|uniref:hypothetical protein n=1 Tax=Streptomyces cyaneus TaxID=1904 RepID=UPI0013E2E0E1|nr:hypothetical protein [Streptomyces cyaneus]